MATLKPITDALKSFSIIKKDGFNQHSRYQFRGIDGVLDVIGPVFRKYGIIVTSNIDKIEYAEKVANGKVSTVTRGIVTYTFHFGDGDSLATTVAAEAQDWGDKGTSKFMSVALRTAILQTFTAPTGEADPDSFTYQNQAQPSPAQGQQATPGTVTAADIETLFTQCCFSEEKRAQFCQWAGGKQITKPEQLNAGQAQMLATTLQNHLKGAK